MMTCKDCLHYGVCYIVENYGDEEANVDGVENDCNEFKDRSRYVVREKGEWEPYYEVVDGNITISESKRVCSVCKDIWESSRILPHCPSCGADMRKGENG